MEGGPGKATTHCSGGAPVLCKRAPDWSVLRDHYPDDATTPRPGEAAISGGHGWDDEGSDDELPLVQELLRRTPQCPLRKAPQLIDRTGDSSDEADNVDEVRSLCDSFSP